MLRGTNVEVLENAQDIADSHIHIVKIIRCAVAAGSAACLLARRH